MGKPISVDLRKRIVSFVDAGHSRNEAAAHFSVSVSFVVKLMARYKAGGSVEPARQGRPPGTGKFAPYRDFLIGRVEAIPDMTMEDLAQTLEETHGVTGTPAALSRFLIRQGLSFKKKLWSQVNASV